MELATRGLDNDTRGWIMCIVSGIACVFGASVICVDCIVRLFPGKSNFRIQDSNVFLASSLSLSFGVMMFSSLYSMLPEAKSYLKGEDWSDQAAGFLMMVCFIGGFIGIQAISRLLHQFMPSHVVDCDHTHDELEHGAKEDAESHNNTRTPSRTSRARRRGSHQRPSHHHGHSHNHNLNHTHNHKDLNATANGPPAAIESTPLLEAEESPTSTVTGRYLSAGGDMSQRPVSPLVNTRHRAKTDEPQDSGRRPSMFMVQKRVMSFVKDTKSNCDEQGSCFGFTDPCGQECFKHINNRIPSNSRQPTILRTTTGPFYPQSGSVFQDGQHHANGDINEQPISPKFRTSRATSRDPMPSMIEEEDGDDEDEDDSGTCSPMEEDDVEAQHHHHVPTNAFLSIGLQTSIAIALHKFPEGFITYATNHANPELGFNVFMALFVHNITEGFAMALPLYMALGSRWKAMAWSAVLGGLSQPFGAAIAVLWFKLAKKTNLTPDAVSYSCLFAITAGIMVSVALQLFVESLSLNHNRNLCIFFGFLGMAILGLSNALFAGH